MLAMIAVFIGAGFGALVRWLLSVKLNPLMMHYPLGTLSANLIGGYLIGVALAFFSTSSLSHEWKLFIITGFLGGLTTFSTFSAEVVLALQEGRIIGALVLATLHMIGSFLMTYIGFSTFSFFKAL